MALRAGWVPCVGIQPPKPSLQFIEEAATVTRECEGMLAGGKAQSSETFSINDSSPKSKPAMKLVMNPKGVQDHTTVEQHYEQLMQESSTSSSGALPSHIGPSVHIPSSPEIAKDIINDMQSPTGKGAALFAKRKKRMDKFIVDETNVQRSSAYQQQSVVQNSSFEQSFTNQVSSFSSSSTSSSGGGVLPQTAAPAPALTAPPGSKKRMQQERDMEQQKIMNEFLNKRESQFQMVKSPWEAALEGNAAAAFKQNTITSKMSSSSFSSTSTVGGGGPATWLEGPKPVPVAAPLPKPARGASLPNPPAPFARPAANGPATLPDISTILTTSNPTKSFKAGGVVITPTLSPHLASKPVSLRSPRSSSVGHKPTEKRLSTIPKAAQYPFPSYLSLASKQGGCVRSSSTSSIPSLAASVSASNPVCDSDFDLKPGSPPIVVQPSHTEAHTNDLVTNGESVVQSYSSVQNNIYKDVKLRKVTTKNTSASASRPSSVHSAPVKHAVSPTPPAFKAAAPAPAVPTFVPAAATPVFVPGASSGNPAPPSGNQGVGFAPTAGVANPSVGLGAANPSVGLGAANPALGAQFTPRATIGNVASPNLADKRKSANFNLAASGWGTYNEYYRPTSFASS